MDQSERRIFHIPFWWRHEKPQTPGTECNARVRVRKREEIGIFARARVKKGFFGGVFNK